MQWTEHRTNTNTLYSVYYLVLLFDDLENLFILMVFICTTCPLPPAPVIQENRENYFCFYVFDPAANLILTILCGGNSLKFSFLFLVVD